MKSLFRRLPKVDAILENEDIKKDLLKYPREIVLDSIREELEEIRSLILQGIVNEENIDERIDNLIYNVGLKIENNYDYSLKKVINATGVVIHTNLGRSVLSKEILENVKNVSMGYSNLEYNLSNGKRGSRYSHVVELIKKITGAEDALIVNNNAAAVLLVLNSLGKNKEMIVSRGELIEIGGSFRIPDVMEQSGNILVEVGSTNKTHLKDYEKAITDETAVFLKVHTSNYKILGFSESVDSKELVDLSKKYKIPVYEDLGSGVLVDLSKYGLTYEPTVQDSLKKGVDIVTFSGDKLLGGPQAGIIVGKKEYIDEMKLNPLNRALRIDKFTISALETVLRYYTNEEEAIKKIPTLKMITDSAIEIENKTDNLMKNIESKNIKNCEISKVSLKSQVGGGSMPLEEMKSFGIKIQVDGIGANKIEEALRGYKIPIITRINDNSIYMDLRTIMEDEYEIVADGIKVALDKLEEC